MRTKISPIQMLAFGFLLALIPVAGVAQTIDYRPLSRFLALNAERPVRALELRQPVDSILLGDAVHVYSLALKKGQFAAVRLDQINGDLLLVLFGPTGKVIDIVDTNNVHETEVATLDVKESGTYFLQVAQFDWKKSATEYRLSLARQEKKATSAKDRADQLMTSWYDPDHAGMAISVMKEDQPIYQRVIGLAQVENRIPITRSTKFELASVSKQFTGFAIARLIEQGKLSREDDIRKWLPELPDFGSIITVGNLLDHTSGLRDWDAAFGLAGLKVEDGITAQQILQFAASQKSLNFLPGERMQYSNTGYTLLGEIIGRVTGKPADKWMQENLFLPFGMNDTRLNSDFHATIADKANSYEGRAPSNDLVSGNSSAAGGSTSILSSLTDLEKWVRLLDSLSARDARLAERLSGFGVLKDGARVNYAYGNWYGERNGLKSISHLGLAAGFRTGIMRFPEQKISVIFLANDGDDATYARATKLSALFAPLTFAPLEVPPDEPPPAPEAVRPTLATSDYLGTYYSDELRTAYEISADEQGLIAVHMLNGKVQLSWNGGDDFGSERFYMPVVRFKRDASGTIEAMFVSTEGARDMEFRKIR